MRRDSAVSLTQNLPDKKMMSWAVTCSRTLAVAAMLPLLVACSSVEQTYSEFFEEEPMPERIDIDEQELEGGSIPNLSTVPMQRPTPTPAKERERLRRSLQEDYKRSGIKRQPDSQSPNQSDKKEVGSDSTSHLDRTGRNLLAGTFVHGGPGFTVTQLAQITANEDVISGWSRASGLNRWRTPYVRPV